QAHGEGGRFTVWRGREREITPREDGRRADPVSRIEAPVAPTRATTVADAVATAMRREAAVDHAAITIRSDAGDAARGGADPLATGMAGLAPDLLGSSFRRTHRRASAASEMRDRKA
ncbi:MAG TPA: hypothetical protein VKQ09_01050, partial [Sphingomonas sp.]|nr:hypothetical protein [Sphingomonas sp.]